MFKRHCEVLTINHTSAEDSVLNEKTVKQKINADVVYYEASYNSIAEDVRGITNVLDAMKSNNPNSVLVFASSGSVYGNSSCIPQTEACPCQPTTLNGLSKLLAEQILQFYALNYNLKTVALRYYNVVGKGQRTGFLLPILNSVRAGQSPVIYGDRYQKRCLTGVNDIVRANISAYEKPEAYGEAFNIAGPEIATIEEIAKMACRLSAFKELKPKYIESNSPAYNFVPSIEKARRILNYSPEENMQDIMLKLLQGGQN